MSGRKLTALVVDNERINTLILEKMLSCFGIEAVCAYNGDECLTECRGKRFDFVFLDIRMPGLSGFDIISQINHLFERKGMDVPVICITGMSGKEEKKKIIAAGFTDIMTKPINRDELRKMIFMYAPAGAVISEETEDDDGEEHLPEALKNIPGLDHEYGISHCGSVSDFLSALTIFNNSVDEKASAMDEYIKRGYIEDLELMVHSLKSTSLVVGAKQISEMAKLLEKACMDHNISLVYSLTPEFIDKYTELGSVLNVILDPDGGERELEIISEKELIDAYNTLQELILSYDRRNADKILDSLKNYNIPPKWKSFFDRLKEHLRKMDWESARRCMDEFGKG